jgi:hypothetical protein
LAREPDEPIELNVEAAEVPASSDALALETDAASTLAADASQEVAAPAPRSEAMFSAGITPGAIDDAAQDAVTPALADAPSQDPAPTAMSRAVSSDVPDRAIAATPPTPGAAPAAKKFASSLSVNKKFMEKCVSAYGRLEGRSSSALQGRRRDQAWLGGREGSGNCRCVAMSAGRFRR